MYLIKRKYQLYFLLIFMSAIISTACSSTTIGGDEPTAQPNRPEATITSVPEPEIINPAPSPIAQDEEGEDELTNEVELNDDTVSEAADLFEEETKDSIIEDGLVIFTTDDRSQGFRSLTSSWNTNWERHTIQYDEILSGGPPRDGIPSIDDPIFISQDKASEWLAGNEPVVTVDLNGEARAYPLQVLIWHEIVNDSIGDLPILVTFCPLCNSAIVFEAIVNGEPTEFGTSGLLRNSDLIMYDRQTESLWQQFTGETIVGDQVGSRLTFLPSSLISFADFQAAYPNGTVLSRNTGINRPYGQNPYVGYDTIGGRDPFLFAGEIDGRLPAVERVVTISLAESGIDLAYPLSTLSEIGVINDVQGGQNLVIFHTDGTASALGAAQIAEAEDVGATGVFNPVLDGQLLTFTQDGNLFIDDKTGSKWNIVGQAIDGPFAGTQLEPIVHGDHFWFSWAAFKPETLIYQ